MWVKVMSLNKRLRLMSDLLVMDIVDLVVSGSGSDQISGQMPGFTDKA